MNIQELLKNKKFTYAAVVLLMGIILIIGGNSLFSTGKKNTKAQQTKPDEVATLESRLEQILSTVKGAGRVSVFVMLEDMGSYDYVKDTKQMEKESQSESEEKTVLAGSSSSSTPIIAKSYAPRVKGIIVTAEGASDPIVKERLKTAVETALAVMPHRVEVVERNK